MLIALSQIASVSTDFRDADFWLKTTGLIDTVGYPYRKGTFGFKFNPNDIGIKVKDGCKINDNYLFWVFFALYQDGLFQQLAINDIDNLVKIKVEDINRLGF